MTKAKKRTKLLIVMELLEVLSSNELPPTRLATLVNMPYDRLANLLRELEEKKLVEVVEGGRSKVVRITEEGLKLLGELKKIKKILDEYGLV